MQRPDELLIDGREAAKRLSMSQRTLTRYVKRGVIPCVKLDRLVRFSPEILRTWIKRELGGAA
ncbi:MAG TPA: helix-turn-helix domain-containing protein [Thermoguttaceae bacterium]|nr:helix-turn-helix domain-containing protein [Thermoguttaceae bacterium]